MSYFLWVKNEELKDALAVVLAGGKPDESAARATLQAIQQETEGNLRRYLSDTFCKQYFPTNRHGGSWIPGKPVGLVDHYTADQNARGALIWFSSKPRPNPGNSSAHVVIDHDGTILVLVDPLTTVAWHATVANRDHIGIEHVNCGILEPTSGQSFRCLSGIYAVKGASPENVDGKVWDPFESAIVRANLVYKRLLVAAIPTLVREHFVEHKAIDPVNKVDCGPLWPLEALNNLVFSWKDATNLKSLGAPVLSNSGVYQFNEEVRVLLET